MLPGSGEGGRAAQDWARGQGPCGLEEPMPRRALPGAAFQVARLDPVRQAIIVTAHTWFTRALGPAHKKQSTRTVKAL